jgi:hypothetical protein
MEPGSRASPTRTEAIRALRSIQGGFSDRRVLEPCWYGFSTRPSTYLHREAFSIFLHSLRLWDERSVLSAFNLWIVKTALRAALSPRKEWETQVATQEKRGGWTTDDGVGTYDEKVPVA